jgi:signal transduction histidine kinase
MIPARVFIGDRARLVLPLPAGFNFPAPDSRFPNVTIPPFPLPDISIHQITIERRPGGNSLIIEFSAYRTGIVELPPFEIAGEIISGLTVQISSMLDSDSSGMVLSNPARPLAIPGTSLLVYGTIGILTLLLLLASFLFRGRKRIQSWLIKWERKRLLAAMEKTEKRLRKALVKDMDRREILDVISVEFRNFLAFITGENCRAMTAAEIGRLDTNSHNLDNESLRIFFKHCDTVRFSGCEIGIDKTIALLDELKYFIAAAAQDRPA